jgi:hypothetical protein
VIDWDYNSGKNAIEFNYRLDSLDPRDPAYSARASVVEKQIPEDQRKQFIQTKQYSDAVNDWHAGREPNRIATALGDQMVQMKKYLDLGDREGALDIAKGGLMKTVNSIQGKDALQLGEQMTKCGMIITGPEYGLQAGGGWLENIGRMLMAKGQSNSDKEKTDISGRIKDAFDLTFNADPDRFYKMSTGIYQAAKETANQHVTRIENMTSPFHAKAMGAVKLPDMSTIEAQQQNRMNPPAPGSIQNPSQMSGNPSPASAGPSAQQLQSIINGGSQFTPEQKAAAARLLNK